MGSASTSRFGLRRPVFTSWVGVVVALAAISAACGGSSGGSGSGGGKGVLRYGYDFAAQSTNFDPGKSTGDCDAIAIEPIYDTLIRRDVNGTLQPGLAKSWETTADAVTLHLQPDVKFQDNTAFDATAVKNGLLHNRKNSTLTDLSSIMGDIDVVDPVTVRIHLKQPKGVVMLYDFTGREGMIVAPAAYDTAATHPVGAGPFEYSSFTPGSKLSIRANPNYFDKGRYKLGGIDLVQVSTGPPAVTALKSGAVDFIRFEAESYAGLKADPKVGVAVQNTGAYLQLQFRFTPPFDDQRVREAVLHAINKDEINKTVQDGLGEVATQPYAKSSPVYDPSIADLYPYDPARSKALLAAAGHANGLSFDMVIPGGNITNMERQGAILQQQLAAVGIKANIVRILGNDIATGYYISGRGNAFSAAKLAEAFPPNLINGSYGKGQFVAIWSHFDPDTNPPMPQLLSQITDLMNRALASSNPDDAYGLTKQASKIVMQNALEAPIAFMPQLVAYDKAKVGGTVKGQTNICDPPDLTGVTVKG